LWPGRRAWWARLSRGEAAERSSFVCMRMRAYKTAVACPPIFRPCPLPCPLRSVMSLRCWLLRPAARADRSGGLGGPNSRVGAVPGGKRAPGADGLAAPGRCLGLGAVDDAVGAPWRPARSFAQPDAALQGYVGPVAVVGDPQGPDSAHRAGAMVSLLGAL